MRYYHAYNERYKKVHSEGLLWASREPTPELLEWIRHYKIPAGEGICEIGCGEGRDAIALSGMGYHITAFDVSDEAIKKCRELASEAGAAVDWIVGDALDMDGDLCGRFSWIYSIATLHMLVEDADRDRFLKSLKSMLKPEGRLLLLTMGDGTTERKTDTGEAFDLKERTHGESGRKMYLAATSYRGVNWEHHREELDRAGLAIEKMMDTENNEYGRCMTVYLARK